MAGGMWGYSGGVRPHCGPLRPGRTGRARCRGGRRRLYRWRRGQSASCIRRCHFAFGVGRAQPGCACQLNPIAATSRVAVCRPQHLATLAAAAKEHSCCCSGCMCSGTASAYCRMRCLLRTHRGQTADPSPLNSSCQQQDSSSPHTSHGGGQAPIAATRTHTPEMLMERRGPRWLAQTCSSAARPQGGIWQACRSSRARRGWWRRAASARESAAGHEIGTEARWRRERLVLAHSARHRRVQPSLDAPATHRVVQEGAPLRGCACSALLKTGHRGDSAPDVCVRRESGVSKWASAVDERQLQTVLCESGTTPHEAGLCCLTCYMVARPEARAHVRSHMLESLAPDS